MAINIPILSSLDASGFEKAAKQFSALKTNGERANFALKKAALPAAAALAAPGYARQWRIDAVIAFFTLPSGPAAWLLRRNE